MSNLDKIWKEFKTNKSKDTLTSNEDTLTMSVRQGIFNDQCKSCTNCFGENLHTNYLDLICHDCGLVISSNYVTNCSSFETVPEAIPKKKFTNYNNKISKMQDWYMWTNDEKNIYKLKTYVKNLCQRLKISEYLIDQIVNVVTVVMDTIKRNDGTKRARVKDGIIVICIYYVSKDTDTPYSYMNMAKQLDLDIKYVTRAERLILELVNSKKLNLSKSVVLDTQKPYDYIINTIKSKNLNINNQILEHTRSLITICEDNDILLDHTPLSVGVSCFYYILKLNNIDIDLKMFSELYDLSVVTVVKTYNKLKVYEKQISNML
jgi:transcription initiation factor TFIIIB Brf1 subunit/transcription initiation factor TFIIB